MVINGVLLDSIGLALFSLAWWGWLIGGGLAVVGMLFGVHVAVGAPEAQAYSSSSYTPEESAARGDVGAMAQLQQQSQPGYTGPASDPMQPSYEQQVYDDFNRGDVSSLQQYEQEKWLNTPNAGPEVRQLTEQEIAERDAAKAAEDAEWAAYQGAWAQYERDLAAWEAQYGSGASGGGGAPVAPASPSGGVASAAGSNPWMADPYYDVESEWASDLTTSYFKSGDNGARLTADQESAKRHYDSDKPLVMKVGRWDSQTFTDRSYALVSSEGVLDETGARVLAQELVKGEVLKVGDLKSARDSAIYWASGYQSQWKYYEGAGDLDSTERNDVHEYKAKAVVATYLVEALNQEIEATEVGKQATVTPRKTKRGAKVLNSEVSQDGRMSATVKTKLKEGSTAQIAVHSADANGAWKEETSKVKVGKGGVVNFSTDVEKYNYVYLENSKGKMLVRWTTA